MDRSGVERRDELGEVVGVSLDTEILAVVGPWLGAEIALGVGDEPISLRDLKWTANVLVAMAKTAAPRVSVTWSKLGR